MLVRLRRLSLGLAGDSRSVGSGLVELRVHIGPGYRVYFAWDGPERVLLLNGGTKATQRAASRRPASTWRNTLKRQGTDAHTKV